MDWKTLPLKGYWKSKKVVKKAWENTKFGAYVLKEKLKGLKKEQLYYTVTVVIEDIVDKKVFENVIKVKRVNNTQLMIKTNTKKTYLPLFKILEYEIISKEDEDNE